MKKTIRIGVVLLFLLCCTLLLWGCDTLDDTLKGTGDCADGHTPDEGEVTVEASCTTKGELVATCTVCGETLTIELPALGHTESDWIVDLAAGCSTAGSKHKECVRCGEGMEQEGIEASGHTPGEWEEDIAVGCFSDGKRHRDCADCGILMESEVIRANGHAPGTWVTMTAATCSKAGSEVLSCTRCSKPIQARALPKLDHTFEWKEIEQATCSKAGKEEQRCTANGCGEIGATRPIPISDHIGGEWIVDEEGSCVNEGYRHKDCIFCGETVEQGYYYPEDAHREGEWVTDVQPGCNKKGSEYRRCLDCGKEIARRSIAAKHVPGAWITIKPSTCKAAGKENQLCASCSTIMDARALPLAPHTPGEWVQDTAPLCEQDGATHLECSVCQANMGIRTIPAKGHGELGDWTVVDEPQCERDGQEKKCCLDCGKTLQTQLIPATGHEQTHWVEAVSLDALPSAYMELRCVKCDALIPGTAKLNKEEHVASGGNSCRVNLVGYRVVYPASASSTFIQHAKDLAARLTALTGQTVSAVPDSTTATAKEILVGRVNRAQVATAMERVSGYGFTVSFVGSTIVITGTTNLIALMGVEYFTQTYVQGGKAQINMPQWAVSDKYRPVTVGNTSGTSYALVYDKNLDTDSASSSNPDIYYGKVSGTGRDYAYDAALSIRDALLSATGASSVTVKKDNATATAKEILVGMPNRTQVTDALSLIAGHEYAIAVLDERVVVTAYSTVELQAVVPMFIHYLGDAKDAQGNIILPFNFRMKGSADQGWFTDAPLPDGVPLYNTADEGDGVLQYLYMGTGVTKAAFDAYRTKLIAAGYGIASENNAEGSCFVTFTNVAKKTMIHVSYNAYTHASGSNWAYPSPSIRVRTGYTDKVAHMLSVMPAALLNPNQSYTKVTDSAITAVPLPATSVGTGYVITLEDGTFIVIDGGSASGGMNNGSNPWYEVKLVWNILSTQYKKIWGKDPSPSNPVHIRAWHITHAHGDHMNVFWDFAHRYGGTGSQTLGAYAKLDYLIANTPAPSMVYNTGEPSMELRTQMTKIRNYFGGFTHLNVQTGQKLYFANAELEVLFTHGDLNPQRIVTFNDTSTVIRFTFTPTNAQGKKGTPVTFVSTGDAYRHSARWMCAMYGDYLKSDMVTLSHHGGPGTETMIYDKIAPKVVWWPHVASAVYGSYLKSSGWYYSVDQYVFFNLSSVEYVYISDKYSVTLDLGMDGPGYDAVHDVGSTTVIQSYTLTASSKVSNSHEIYTKRPVVVKRKR